MSSPFERYNKANHQRWEVLDDFPEWEKANILDWIHALLYPSDQYGRRAYNPKILHYIQSKERIMLARDIGVPIDDWVSLHTTLVGLINSDEADRREKAVLFIELLVKYVRDSSDRHRFGTSVVSEYTSDILSVLERRLQNGSNWRVVTKKGSEAGLIERVNPELLEIAKNSLNDDLHKAWNYAFGAAPKPELAIVHAQSAIEYVASKAGLTNATSKVYGTIIGDITKHKGMIYHSVAKPEFDKILELSKRSGSEIDNLFAEWFVAGMDLIQKSNPVRHKSKGIDDFKVSSGASRQAVIIATAIYEIIDKRYIFKKSSSERTTTSI